MSLISFIIRALSISSSLSKFLTSIFPFRNSFPIHFLTCHLVFKLVLNFWFSILGFSIASFSSVFYSFLTHCLQQFLLCLASFTFWFLHLSRRSLMLLKCYNQRQTIAYLILTPRNV